MEKSISEVSKNNNKQKKGGKTSNSVNTSRVKELRNRIGLTQEEFANRLNRDFQMISHIERGTKGLYLPFAIEICKEFDVSLDWLYELSDDTKDTASNIVDNLKSVFDIDLKNKAIKIGKELAGFIQKLSLAYKTKNEQGMPEEAFKYWIDGIKNEFNEIMKQKKYKETDYTKYYLDTIEENCFKHPEDYVIEDGFANAKDGTCFYTKGNQ